MSTTIEEVIVSACTMMKKNTSIKKDPKNPPPMSTTIEEIIVSACTGRRRTSESINFFFRFGDDKPRFRIGERILERCSVKPMRKL